jgi:hypothetical protein
MSVVPHTRTHGLKIADHANEEDPILLLPVTQHTNPVQIRIRDNGFPDEPQRWAYTREVFNLQTLIENFEIHYNFRNPARGIDMDFIEVDPVRWDLEGGVRPPNLDPNYVTDTETMLTGIRGRQAAIREAHAARQQIAYQRAIEIQRAINLMAPHPAGPPLGPPHPPPQAPPIPPQPQPTRQLLLQNMHRAAEQERLLMEVRRDRARAASRAAAEAEGRGSSGESRRDMGGGSAP